MSSHLVISDPQRKPEQTHEDMTALGNLVVERKPDVIVCVGDWWDMPSLSSYDEGSIHMEGQRYALDIEAGNEAMDEFLDPIKFYNKGRKKKYTPRMVFLIGNHEQRIERFIAKNPKLEDQISYDDLYLDDWEVYDFLKPVFIDGVWYSHYFQNNQSGKPLGGSIVNKLNKLKFSFTQGHTQTFQHHKEYLANGIILNGLVSGSFYGHKERYLGHQGNHHWRGVIYKHDVKHGDYDLETISIQRLMKEYG